MRLDLGSLRKMQDVAKALQAQAMEILSYIARLGMFCDECGETKPESGFYPLMKDGMGSLSGYTCNDCMGYTEIRSPVKPGEPTPIWEVPDVAA